VKSRQTPEQFTRMVRDSKLTSRKLASRPHRGHGPLSGWIGTKLIFIYGYSTLAKGTARRGDLGAPLPHRVLPTCLSLERNKKRRSRITAGAPVKVNTDEGTRPIKEAESAERVRPIPPAVHRPRMDGRTCCCRAKATLSSLDRFSYLVADL
jgi:hypothetical protein